MTPKAYLEQARAHLEAQDVPVLDVLETAAVKGIGAWEVMSRAGKLLIATRGPGWKKHERSPFWYDQIEARSARLSAAERIAWLTLAIQQAEDTEAPASGLRSITVPLHT